MWVMNNTVMKYVNVPLKWTIKDNNAFAKNKFRFSYNEVPWKYTANSQNTHAEVWPQRNCIATLLKSHFGKETTPQTRRLLLVRRPTKDCFWKENRIYEKIYIYIHNTNMMKYCAVNLNASYRLSFKYSRDNTYVFSNENNWFYTAYVFALTLLY